MRQTDGCFSIRDMFTIMKPKQKKEVRYITYFNLFLNILLDMFEYVGLPDTIPARFLECILHSKGEVFIGHESEEAPLVACTGSLSGEIDDYSMGTECVCVTPRQSFDGKRNIDVAYGINNKTATPDTLLYWLSHMLGENDLSMELVSIHSRLLPIPKVCDEKSKQMFEELLKKVIDGDSQAYASNNCLPDDVAPADTMLDITDPQQVDKLQYLSRFADDIIKRFFNFYGQPLQTQNKSAQTISDELHGMDSVSFILPLQMLQCRQELCDNINRIFGLNVSVRFSEPWELEYRKFVSNDTDGDGVSDSVELPTEEPADDTTDDPTEEAKGTSAEELPTEEPEETDGELYRESDETLTEEETPADEEAEDEEGGEE